MSKINSEHPQPRGPAGKAERNTEKRGDKPETVGQGERFHHLMHQMPGKRDHDGEKESTGKSDPPNPMTLLKGIRHGQRDKGQSAEHKSVDPGTLDKGRAAKHEPMDHGTRDKDHRDPSDQGGGLQQGGERILQGMLAPGAPEAPVEGTPSSATDHISEIADKIANRVLVSDKSASTDSEVRIQLNDSTLRGSEISIRHDQGQVVVGFTVPDSQVSGQLTPHTDDLQRSLEQRLNEPVRVEVNVHSGGSDSQGDGRSRNRRDAWEEWKQNQDD